MAITWRTDYAIRLLYELARLEPGCRGTVRELAAVTGVSYDYARGIAANLVAAGLLVSRRGVNGGVRLAREAEKITLLDIFQAMDEPVSIALCTGDKSLCERATTCPIHQVIWAELDARIEGYLGATTLADAVKTGQDLGDPVRLAANLA